MRVHEKNKTLSMEIWNDISGYNGLYQISTLGRVRSLKNKKAKILSQAFKDGYKVISLYRNGNGRMFRVHRLVALSFIDNPKRKPCIDHINGMRDDNRVENLRWCTKKENANYDIAIMNYRNNAISKRGKNVRQYENGVWVADYAGCNEASRMTGICNSSISDCCNGKRKTAGGYEWIYV